MAESELLKLGVTGIFGVVFLYAIAKFFEFLTKRMTPKNGNGRPSAGEMPPEYYDRQFDKMATAILTLAKSQDTMSEILGGIKEILIEIRAEARGKNNGER